MPLYLHLAALVGERAPVFDLICTITGLGSGFGALPANARMTQAGLDRIGVDVAIFRLQGPGVMVLVIWMGLGLLTTILLGAGADRLAYACGQCFSTHSRSCCSGLR